jgi:hypothetical protein
MMKAWNPPATRSLLREWVVKQNGKVSPDQVADDTPLLEQRIITSLRILDLILFIERLRGVSIDIQLIKPGSFHSIDAIMTHFFRGPDHG